jgi:hypothetical protein
MVNDFTCVGQERMSMLHFENYIHALKYLSIRNFAHNVLPSIPLRFLDSFE